MTWLDDSDSMKIQKKTDLLRLLATPSKCFLGKTAQRDISILPVDPVLTFGALADYMKAFLQHRDVQLQKMDTGEEAFVFQYIQLEAVDGSSIDLYVKAKFGQGRETLVIFSAHPDRRWS
jgi:hypothetical protein